MLTIRAEQMRALASHRQADFEKRAHRAAMAALAEHGRRISAEDLLPHVRGGIERGAIFGIVRECDVAEYILILCLYLGGCEDPEPSQYERAFLTAGGEPEDRLRRLRGWAQPRFEARLKALAGGV